MTEHDDDQATPDQGPDPTPPPPPPPPPPAASNAPNTPNPPGGQQAPAPGGQQWTPPPRQQPGGGGGGGGMRVPWRLVIIGVLIAGGAIYGAVTSADRGADGQITGGGTLDVRELRVGDCLQATTDGEVSDVEAVPCTDEHDDEVYFVGQVADGAFPGDDQLLDDGSNICYQQWTSFVGRPYEESVLDFALFVPTASSWDEGDRDVTCLVYDPAGPVTGTLRGADR